MNRRLLTCVVLTTIAFWLLDLIVFTLLFATSFVHLVVHMFVGLGVPLTESGFQNFLSHVMKILAWPVRLFFPHGSVGDNAWMTILLLGLNSVLWGIGIGALVYRWRKPDRNSDG